MFLPEAPSKKLGRFRSLVKSFAEKIGFRSEQDYRYARYNEDHSRGIVLWADLDCEVSRACYYAVYGDYHRRIMEICRGGEVDDFHFTIMVEGVSDDDSTLITRWGHYSEDGILHLTGKSGSLAKDPSRERHDHLTQGFYRLNDLLPVIDFDETVKRFMANAISQNPSFLPPELVSPWETIDEGDPDLEELGLTDLLRLD